MSNMTYSLVYHFVPKSEERKAFLRTAEDVAKMYKASIVIGKNGEVTLAGLTAKEVAPVLVATGLAPYTEWPRDIVTCNIEMPLPLRAVGMEDGWEIFLGDNVFIGFVTLADEAVTILEHAGTLYTEQEQFESLPQFVERIGLDAFRREVLGTDDMRENMQMPENYHPGGEFFDFSYGPQAEFYEREAAPMLQYGDFIRPEDNIMQIITVYPEMGMLFMEYGMQCIGCVASYSESLWEACQVHGLDVFEILGEMNEYLADKLDKELITEEMPLQELLTLYPQTLATLQEYGIELPDDMATTLGELTAANDVSMNDVKEQLHRVLRKE